MAKIFKNNAADRDDLISISEASRIRGVSHTAIQDLIKREKISFVEIGGRRFVSRSEVEKFQPESIGRPPKPKDEASKVSKRGGKKN
jgi:excisionase family DNA binding protein